MDYGHYAILLLAVGLAVLVVEVFVPSGGLLAGLTLLCLTGSVLCAFWAWWGSHPLAFWTYTGGVALLIPATLGGSLYMLPRTAFGRRLLQEAPEPGETASFTREKAALNAAVGHRGVTVTLLNPGGMVEVDGRRWHAESRGLMLDPGETIEVVGVRGNRLLVRLADAPVPPALEGDASEEPETVAEQGSSPVAPVIDADSRRPGGHIAPDAPVGYAPSRVHPPRDAQPESPPLRDERPVAGRPGETEVVEDPFAADAEREGLG